jgi:pyroglutamyl-peptidase
VPFTPGAFLLLVSDTSSMSTILVTGFEPFATSSLNPSGEIVKALIGDDLVTAILPVVFGQASSKLKELIDLHKPTAVLCLGQAEGRSAMTPERIAINLDDARIADNAGNQPKEQKIIANGADGYISTLPIEQMVTSMKAAGIPASISLSAGTFVCNHIFYVLQDYLKESNIPSGFMHVPLMDEQRKEYPNLPTMPIRQMIAGVEIALNVLRIETT